ncbi:MAG: 30S ribosomal protein S6 [Vicinamibacterales bacterium]|jgi:small subunit ribosomal protein S6|nr:30S ribosomal protein S6 [Acidobacteriota bacterium]MDP7472213.1 30S ribosomal protein S6 [Vicinamibacterales bacterium]MDP7672107.1 30S ribosomal protein S6 [Vicinamibacterales bacterium]HJO39581.1 30S ribosomal protein S6 [Vicinamibacterales bacterium]
MATPRQYELVYIVAPSATEETVAELHTQVEAIVEKFGGTLDKTENWGRRKLAYEINRAKEGTYVLELLTGSGEMMSELERRLRVADTVLRHLVVRVDEELRVAGQTTARRVAERARRRAARGLPPQPAAAPASTEPTAAAAAAPAATESEAPAAAAAEAPVATESPAPAAASTESKEA